MLQIWLLIFDRIENPSDIETIKNSCPYFRKLILRKFSVTHLPRALKIMERNRRKKGAHPTTEGTTKFFKDNLNLRRVCKTWNSDFDSFFKNQSNLLGTGVNLCETIELSRSDRNSAQKFLSHFHDTHAGSSRSPFFNNEVKIVKYGEHVAANRNQTLETVAVFENFGHHIQSLHVNDYFIYRQPQAQNNLVALHQIFDLIPNVKKLSLYKYGNPIAGIAFPEFAMLQTLTVSGLEPSVVNALLKTNSNIKTLSISWSHNISRWNFDPIKFPNLKNLSLHGLSDENFIKFAKANYDMPVESLSIRFEKGQLHRLKKCFKLVNRKWGKTMTCLNLALYPEPVIPRSSGRKIGKLPKLDLPNVEHLFMELGNFFSVDFLVPMKNNLNTLSVIYMLNTMNSDQIQAAKELTMENEKKIKFLKFSESPAKSNIWRFFPSLFSVMVGTVGKQQNWSAHASRTEWVGRQDELRNLEVATRVTVSKIKPVK